MGILANTIEKRNKRSPLDDFWYTMYPGIGTESGEDINEARAYNYSAYYACVTLLSRMMGMLPKKLYRRTGDNSRTQAKDHYLFKKISLRPNDETVQYTFFETMQGHLTTWGNCYAQKEMERGGRIKNLWPLRPDKMKVERKAGKLNYRYTPISGKARDFNKADILHIPGFSYNGIEGKSPMMMMRESLGIALAAEKYQSKFLLNYGNMSGVIQHPKASIAPEKAKQMRNDIHSQVTGEDRFKPLILFEGATWEQIGVPPETAQLLETQKFNAVVMARWHHIPPHMIADLDRATFSNIEHQDIEFTKYTMGPWFRLWEDWLNIGLLPDNELDEYYIKIIDNALLRSDHKSRAEFYNTMFQTGAYSPNHILELEDENPVEGGDERFVPLNMVPLSLATQAKKPDSNVSYENISNNAFDEEYIERRAQQAAQIRKNIEAQYKPIIRKKAAKIIRAEVREIKKAVKKYLTQRDYINFEGWMRQYYIEHQRFIGDNIAADFEQYSQVIGSAAAEEIGVGFDNTFDYQDFVNGYTQTFVMRHVGSSQGQLINLIKESQADDAVASDLILERLKEWNEKRPDKIANRETVEADCAFAVAMWTGAGIPTKIWVNTGRDNCPYCKSLNGRKIGIYQSFLRKDQEFQPEGAETPFKPSADRRHPPIHGGCDCAVVAGF